MESECTEGGGDEQEQEQEGCSPTLRLRLSVSAHNDGSIIIGREKGTGG